MKNAVISIDSVSKIYRPRASHYQTLRQALVSIFSKKAQTSERLSEVTALESVSFKVEPGEIVGIIGKNGSGKSTLLKLLSRVTPPSGGSIRLRGRVSSLLEVGTGFHPELTGRQNIFLNGTLLGMRRFEIKKRFDEIVDFSEVAAFLDLPVKFYSSGMYMRLAFAVAAHLDPEILIIDEVLAVGDAAFQQKCVNKVRERGGQGGTIIFVSHILDVVATLCSRVIHLERGSVIADGASTPVIAGYLERQGFAGDRIWSGNEGDEHLRLRRFELMDARTTLESSDALRFEMEVEVHMPTIGVLLGVNLCSSYDRLLAFSAFDDTDVGPAKALVPGRHVFTVEIPANSLAAGSYLIRPSILLAGRKRIVYDVGTLRLNVSNTKGIGRRYVDSLEGIFRPPWNWTVSGPPGTSTAPLKIVNE